MNINGHVTDCVKKYIENSLLRGGYKYFVDKISSAIYPNTVSIFLWSTDLPGVESFLRGTGLTLAGKMSTSQKVLGVPLRFSMAYKDILTIAVTNDRRAYDDLESKAITTETISLKSIIENLVEAGHDDTSIRNLLSIMTKKK